MAAQLAEWETLQQQLTDRQTAKVAKLEEERAKRREEEQAHSNTL